MRDENLIWRKNLFITMGAHFGACSRKEVMNEELSRRAGTHPKQAPISSSLRAPLAERARRLRMRAASRAIPQEESARLWEHSLPALSLREDLRDCFVSGPSQAPASEGLGGGLLRGVERTIRRLPRTARQNWRMRGSSRACLVRFLQVDCASDYPAFMVAPPVSATGRTFCYYRFARLTEKRRSA